MAVVGGDGLAHPLRLAVLAGQLGAGLGVVALVLVIDGLADVVQEPREARELDVGDELGRDQAGEVADLDRVGEQVMGVLDVQQNTPGALGSDDVDMLQTIANQVAIALQNARAYERTRRQVVRAVMVNTIGQKIQETSSVDKALRVAVRELGRAVGAPETSVRLGGQSTVQ